MRVIIIGQHPIVNDLVRQYEDKGYNVELQQDISASEVCLNNYDEMFLLSGSNEDEKSLVFLAEAASTYKVDEHKGRRMICHLLLQSRETLKMLQGCDLCDAIKARIDVYPFTLDDVWSQSIVLDREAIGITSQKHVHLVVFGMGEIAESVAIHAAHVAHYPNYTRNHNLRTRITFVSADAERESEAFVKRYQHLFDNSFYRVVKLSDTIAVSKFHRPIYDGNREDFVDVEWEFVEAEYENADLRKKLQVWAESQKQLLTLVFAEKDGNKNLSHALVLPNAIFANQIPIYLYSQGEIPLPDFPGIRLFGLQNKGYDTRMPLVEMAKSVKYIYEQCYKENIEDWSGQVFFPVEIDNEERERLWASESSLKRQSCISNAMSIPSKMRSIGLEENDWDKFYDLSQEEIEILSEVEHNRWSVEELIHGFRPCTDEEDRAITADVAKQKGAYKSRMIHYDLRAYNELRPDGTGKSVKVYDWCLCSSLPLIVKFLSEKKESFSEKKDFLSEKKESFSEKEETLSDEKGGQT